MAVAREAASPTPRTPRDSAAARQLRTWRDGVAAAAAAAAARAVAPAAAGAPQESAEAPAACPRSAGPLTDAQLGEMVGRELPGRQTELLKPPPAPQTTSRPHPLLHTGQHHDGLPTLPAPYAPPTPRPARSRPW